MTVRTSGLARLVLAFFASLFALHFLSATFSASDNAFDDGEEHSTWGERLGLDHYAEWEAEVTDKLGGGIEKVKGSLGSLQAGLSWAFQGPALGSLYELVTLSNPSSTPIYYDQRSSIDKLKLTSSRVVGHGGADDADVVKSDAKNDRRIPSRRHILVTGGFGSLGKHVVRDLLLGPLSSSAPVFDRWGDAQQSLRSSDDEPMVTILDVQDRRDELNFLLQESGELRLPLNGKKGDSRASKYGAKDRTVQAFIDSGRLRIMKGDVRDVDLMATILAMSSQAATRIAVPIGESAEQQPRSIPPISGIIHLASYAPSACINNPVDCRDVEVQSMRAILGSLARDGLDRAATLSSKAVSADRPWLVVPRRDAKWTHADRGEEAAAAMTDARQAAAKILQHFATEKPIHAINLHLPPESTIIGDPFASRFAPVPHIVQAALGDLPIQTFDDTLPARSTFLALDEASRAIVQAGRMLAVAYSKTYVRELAFISDIHVDGPHFAHSWSELVQEVSHLTGSQSAFVELAPDARSALTADDQTMLHARRRTMSKALGFSPSMSLRDALVAYLSSLLRLHSEHLSKKINVACSTPPSITVLEEALLGLSGCNVQLLTLIEGAFRTLGCSEGIDAKIPTPLALTHAVPFKEGVRGVEIFAERGLEGKVDLQFRCPKLQDGNLTGESELVLWADTSDGGEFAPAEKDDLVPISEWFTVDFVQRESRAFTMTLPPTEGMEEGEEPKRRLMFKDEHSSRKQLIFQPPSGDTSTLLWKINPICCPSNEKRKTLWNFFKDDPLLTSQVAYPSYDGRTGMPESTHSLRRCADLRSEHDRLSKVMDRISRPVQKTCSHSRGQADDWSIKDLPICQIDCKAPLVCVSSKKCRCASDRCGQRQRVSPFPDYQYTNKTTYPPATSFEVLTLKERVENIAWDSLILPAARPWFRKSIDQLPKGHVIEISKRVDTHLESSSCYDIDKAPLPFLGDHFMIEALRNRSIPANEADFAMIPFYQGCYYNYLQQNTFHKLTDTVAEAETSIAAMKQITPSKIAVPFTHDFGSCTGWWPRLEEVLPRTPPSPMDKAISWQPNGEYNTRCYKPGKDIVTPAVSKHTKALFATFSDLKKVAPVTQRGHLGFFAGGVRGFGAIARTRIGCERTEQPADSPILYQQFAPGQRYLGTLNSAKFCLLPRGIPAWTTRTFEAIYAGCIPAFIADRTSFPFEDILDYSQFSVTIPESDSHDVEEILKRYDDEQLIKLQSNLLRVRDAFIYDEGREWERRGPLYFTLLSMAMRIPHSDGYPQAGSCSSV